MGSKHGGKPGGLAGRTRPPTRSSASAAANGGGAVVDAAAAAKAAAAAPVRKRPSTEMPTLDLNDTRCHKP